MKIGNVSFSIRSILVSFILQQVISLKSRNFTNCHLIGQREWKIKKVNLPSHCTFDNRLAEHFAETVLSHGSLETSAPYDFLSEYLMMPIDNSLSVE